MTLTERHILVAAITLTLTFTACAAPSAAVAPSPQSATVASVVKPSGNSFGIAAGNPAGKAKVPKAAKAEKTSKPTRVIGDGTPASCTSDAVVAAVAKGGIVKFNCGPSPVTIVMTKTAKVLNTNKLLVLDGGNKVTLSGDGKHRILYQNTCDRQQVWTMSHCQNQSTPKLVVQNLTFADGNSTGEKAEGGGGGAIFVRGGQFKVVNSVFVRNKCDATGPDLGGAAIRVLSQYKNRTVYVNHSTFGGAAGMGGVCSNGGALSSIGVSWTVLNSVFSDNTAIGYGANPKRSGTPGGGSGGAIYADGNKFNIRIAGTIMKNNHAKEGGGAIFFVSNNRTGTLKIETSKLTHNPSDRFSTRGYPGIFFLGKGKPKVSKSTLR